MDLLLRTTILHPTHGVVTVEIDESEFFPGVYPLTQCCEAAATGLGSGGIGCKGCYKVVPDWFANFARTVDDLKATIA